MEAPKLKLTDSEKSKLYRQRNPERQCGAIVCNKVRPQHLRSTKHKERMELINKYKSSSDSEDTSSS